MPLALSHIRKTLATYLDRHPHEWENLGGLAAALDGAADPISRFTYPAHITCAAVVIDRARRVLHISHKGSGETLLAPRGHADTGDRTLLAAAVRELQEETGIRPQDLCLTPQFFSVPIDVDVQEIRASPAEGEPAHQHYDFLFAFYLASLAGEDPPPLVLRDGEAVSARWLPFADVPSPKLRAKLLQAENEGLDGTPEPVGASALIHDGHGRYLLHLRDQRDGIAAPGAFALLGGRREAGDSCLQETVWRELAEEAPGLALAELSPYTVEMVRSVDGPAVPIQIYTARWSGDPDTVDLQEGVLLRWFTPQNLDRLRLGPGTRELIHRHSAEHPAASAPTEPLLRTRHGEAAGEIELHIVGVHLYLQDDQGRVLLGLRHPSANFAGNQWHFLAGRCQGESAISCLVREAKEDGIILDPDEIELVHLVHHIDAPGAPPRIQLVFRAHSWSGTPHIRKPDRCVEWGWWAPEDLPAEVVPYARLAIDGVLAGRTYSQMGWG